ncbi:cobalamin B12-binding domain-containing protein [Nocardioides sp. KIGAM211]|uniref:Cobalamin B12-binding domain-containing protein n=1 Tax=Nocardioides luti TaxID=2761101 RepID=A0A7X0VA66_9ACTN|nr:cobalamin B12-binding domain-containing protein [Nocardioides luti]
MTTAVHPDDREAYWLAVEAADESAAYAAAVAAHGRGVPLDSVLVDLVSAAQLRVGELWATNSWTVAREHAATAVSESVVRRLADDLPVDPDAELLLVACVEREWHGLPALVVAQTLRSWGHRVDHLGANATRERVVERILATRPRAVLLSASLSSSLPRVHRQVAAIRETGTPVVVGGRAFDSAGVRARRLGATAYAGSPRDAVEVLATLPHEVPPAPELTHAGVAEARELQARADDLARDLVLGTDTRLGLSGGGEAAVPPDDWRVVLATFAPHVVDCVVGALLTEDDTVLADSRAWLAEVLAGRGADPAAADAMWETLARLLTGLPEASRLLGRG